MGRRYSVTYTYNNDGLRTTKTVNGIPTSFVYQGSLLMADLRMGSSLYFSYDASGSVVSVNYNDTEYYYLKNGQGDIVGLIDGNGTRVVSYSYDSWGKPISTTGTLAGTLGVDNPLRYRGYYYDGETGLYYLQSRYYDAEVGRFLNGDVYASTGQGFVGMNMYAYCNNNPIMGYDPTGHFGLIGAIVATGAIVGGLLGAFSAATTGGNIVESAIEGCLTGALGAACGIGVWGAGRIMPVVIATLGSAIIDIAVQATTQYIETKSVDLFKLDYGRALKTGIQTGIGTAIPQFGDAAGNAADAFGTALIWAEASTMLVCTDVVVTNAREKAKSSSRNVPKTRRGVAIHERKMLLM